jgi:membrane-associated protease RseP (regulator of RpoE activity)
MGRFTLVFTLLSLSLLGEAFVAPGSSATTHKNRFYSDRRAPLLLPKTQFRSSSQLEASPLLAVASSPLGSLGILAFIVLVHESGHYLAARGFNMKVEEFSIGIGPKLAGFKAFGDEFNLRVLPLGGYVRFPENYDAEAVRKEEQAAMKAVDQFTNEKLKDPSTKLLNALTLGALGDKEIKKENERRQAELEKLRQLPWWKKLGKNMAAEKDLAPIVGPDEVEIGFYNDPQLLQNRPWYERAVVLSGGVIFNFVLAFTIYFGLINMGPGLPSPVFTTGALVTSAPAPGAAANGILQKGDLVLEVNGRPVIASPSPSASQAQKGINAFISQIRATPEGESLKLKVLQRSASVPVELEVAPKRQSGTQAIGVLLSPNFVKSEVLKSNNVIEASKMAAKFTNTLIVDTASGLATVFTGFLSGKSTGAQLSGPIGLIKTGSEVVSSQDMTAVLLFMAALSVNLGVVNAFPLPALDGGQLLFVLFEAISGRKVNQRVQEGITGATLLLLLLISASAAVGDIENLVIGR